MKEQYEYINELPLGEAGTRLTEGCMVLEGGAFRGLYSQGVLDYLMENDVNMQTTIGVSAGAMAGVNYVSGQIGRSIRINLSFRHDSDYIGLGAMKRDHGITGFSYLWNEISSDYPLNEERFNDPSRRFVAVATNIETGKAEYFERGKCSDILKAVSASATIPYVSKPVEIDGKLYLDGGCAEKIPYQWALKEGFKKIIVIRTRDAGYRKDVQKIPRALINGEYAGYPELRRDLLEEAPRYNITLDALDQLYASKRIFMLCPSKPININRFEGDLSILADVYHLGYEDMKNHFEELQDYLKQS